MSYSRNSKRYVHSQGSSVYPRIPTNYYSSMGTFAYFDSQVNLSNNTLYGMAYPIDVTMTVDRIAVDVSTLDAAGHLRLGIYLDNGQGYPSTLLIDGGAVATGAAEIKYVAIADTKLYGGNLYWIAALSDSNVVKCHATISNAPNNPIILGKATALDNPFISVNVVQAYGALPNPFTAAASYVNYALAFALRLKSVP